MGDEGISSTYYWVEILMMKLQSSSQSLTLILSHKNMYVATQSGNLCPTSVTKFKAWDSSRVSASIPSGVGFLGAGLIVKSSEKDPITGESHHLVQGITTAAATWYVLIYVL